MNPLTTIIMTVTLALATAGGLYAYNANQQSIGAVKERARVEEKGRQVDAKAQTARARAAAKPDGVLARYFRD